MKTAFRIFGILAILIALLTCSMSIYRANLDKGKLAGQEQEMADARVQIAAFKEQVKMMTGESKTQMDEQIATAEKALNELPSSSTYLILEVLLTGLLLLALAFGVFLFRPNLKLATALFWAAVVVTIAAVFLSPDIKRGTYGGLESRTLALLSGIPVVVTGLCAFLVAKKNA